MLELSRLTRRPITNFRPGGSAPLGFHCGAGPVPGLGVGLYGPDVPLAPLLLPLAPFCSSVRPLLFSGLGLTVSAGLAGFT